jgi:hypothetical protein
VSSPGPGCSKQWIKLSTGQIWFILDNFCPLDKCGCSKVIHWTNMIYLVFKICLFILVPVMCNLFPKRGNDIFEIEERKISWRQAKKYTVISIGDHIYPLDKTLSGCSKQWIKLSTGQIWFIQDNFVQSNLVRIKFYPVDKYDRQLILQ